MIPRIIHFCWFGYKEKSELALQCIESWKNYCPDFEFKEWNETTSKPFQNKFYRDAYRKKKYAFVADCVRVQALYRFGGIYLDLDMLLLKPIDHLLCLNFFTGFEIPERPAYGIFGGTASHRFFKEMKFFYKKTHFNQFSPPVITHAFKKLITKDVLCPLEEIFNPHTFYALPYKEKDKPYHEFITTESIAVHLWEHSWKKQKNESVKQLFKKLWITHLDTLFYNYPFSYYKRYVKEFSRKLYYKMLGND